MSGEIPDDVFRPEQGRESAPAAAPGPDVPPGEAAERPPAALTPSAPTSPFGATRRPRARPSDEGPTGAVMPVVTSAGAARALPHAWENLEVGAATARRHPWPLGLLAVLLALVVGLAGGQLIKHTTGSDRATPTQTPATSRTPARLPWPGPGRPLAALSVMATCSSPDSTDGSGRTMSYPASHVLDSRPDTAWRCNGDGVGQKLVFTLPAGSVLVGVSLINGYVTTEGTASLYEQYRRVLTVRWDLPDGSWFVQNLSENSPEAQVLMIPPTRLDGPVRMTIQATSKPGQVDDPRRDAVLVSEVSFLTQE